MREIRPYGSVRGVPGDRHPYRDPSNPVSTLEPAQRVPSHRGEASPEPNLQPPRRG